MIIENKLSQLLFANELNTWISIKSLSHYIFINKIDGQIENKLTVTLVADLNEVARVNHSRAFIISKWMPLFAYHSNFHIQVDYNLKNWNLKLFIGKNLLDIGNRLLLELAIESFQIKLQFHISIIRSSIADSSHAIGLKFQ